MSFGRPFSVCFSLTVVVIALVVPGAATAQTESDPAAGSPPQAVYQIPLQGGRADAAPRKSGPDSGGAGSGSGGSAGDGSGGSLYRSENDFGSSSDVPGAAQGSGDAGDKGTTSKVARAVPVPQSPADDGGTSVPAVVWLLALIAVAGTGIGVIAVRSARRGP